jgi:hypothetical protein
MMHGLLIKVYVIYAHLAAIPHATCRCTALKSLPHSIGQLTSLTLLDISSCKELDTLPVLFGDLTALRILNMRLQQGHHPAGVIWQADSSYITQSIRLLCLGEGAA